MSRTRMFVGFYLGRQPLGDAREVGHFLPQAGPGEAAFCADAHGPGRGDDESEFHGGGVGLEISALLRMLSKSWTWTDVLERVVVPSGSRVEVEVECGDSSSPTQVRLSWSPQLLCCRHHTREPGLKEDGVSRQKSRCHLEKLNMCSFFIKIWINSGPTSPL